MHRYASEPTIVRYAKIAMKMKDKTVRDVALRCRWMTVRLYSHYLWNLYSLVSKSLFTDSSF